MGDSEKSRGLPASSNGLTIRPMKEDPIPVPVDTLLAMLELLNAVVREAGQQDKVELVELSERCRALVAEALRVRTN